MITRCLLFFVWFFSFFYHSQQFVKTFAKNVKIVNEFIFLLKKEYKINDTHYYRNSSGKQNKKFHAKTDIKSIENRLFIYFLIFFFWLLLLNVCILCMFVHQIIENVWMFSASVLVECVWFHTIPFSLHFDFAVDLTAFFKCLWMRVCVCILF